MRIAVPPSEGGIRLDVFLLRLAPPGTTRGDVQRAIRDGRVQITGKRVVKPGTLVRAGQEIRLAPAGAWTQAAPDVTRQPSTGAPFPPLKILHEDPTLVVLDKPAGVPVHAGVRREPSLTDALLARYPALAGIGEHPARPGIVHRLDKDSSGVLAVARTQEMYEHLKRQFQERRVRKEYAALVHGIVPEDAGTVKLPLVRSRRNPLRRTIAPPGEGKEAETSFTVLERFREHTLLAVFPRTGRMHQIRVHLAHLGFPVAGDALYGRKSRHRTPQGLARQFLHATALTLLLPSGKIGRFLSPLPDELASVLEALRATPQEAPGPPLGFRWRTPRAQPTARRRPRPRAPLTG